MNNKPKKCYNCKHASPSFKIAELTYNQCCHPKHEEGLKSGDISPWDTLQVFYNTCPDHELKPLTS